MITREFTIYKIENQQNGRVYVGCTEIGEYRIKGHFYNLKRGKHTSRIMQADFDNGDTFRVVSVYAFSATVSGRYKDDSQSFCIMLAAHEIESYYIHKFEAATNGYNNKNYQVKYCTPQGMPDPLKYIVGMLKAWKMPKSKLKEFSNLYPTKDNPENDYTPIDLYFSKANGIKSN